MNFGGTSKRIIMMEYFYRKQTTQIGTLWLVQGLADSYQSQQKMFSGMIISVMT